MRKTKELETVQILFLALNKNQKLDLLTNSNLTDRESELLIFRLVKGKTLKDCSEYFGIEEDSVNKAQLKAIKKFYNFLKIKSDNL